VRALLLESVWLGLVGGALGLALAYVGLHFLLALAPVGVPRLGEIAIDTRALAFTLVLSLLSGLLFGSVPALKYARPRISAALHGEGRTLRHSRERHRARDVLVVAQVALALVLLVSAGLMIRTLHALLAVEPGFTQPEYIQTARINIPALVAPAPEQAARMHQRILDELAAIPGVTAVAFSNLMPMPLEGVAPPSAGLQAEGRTDDAGGSRSLRAFKYVGPGLFHTLGARLIAGRDFTWADIYDRRTVAMVSENLARELWGTPIAALGKRIRWFGGTPWREVIGVAQDVRDNGPHEQAPTIVYWPFMVADISPTAPLFIARSQTFAIRSPRAGTAAFLREVHEAVWSVNANLALSSVRTMQELNDRSLARTSFTLVMLTIAATMALVLGLVGIYGVISYVVSQRTREIGIRLALGAQQGALTRMFVSQSLVLAGAGVAIGLAAASGLTRFMSSLLYGISPLDPTTYFAVSSLLVLAAVLASYLPARRASAVDPVEALKAE
jgi:predicted permease